VRGRCRPRGEKVGEQRPDRRFAQVFGVWLEGEAPDGKVASVEVAAAYGPGKKSIPSLLEHVLERVGVEDFERPVLQLLAPRLREPLACPLRQRPETTLEQLLQQRALAFEAAFFLPLPCPEKRGQYMKYLETTITSETSMALGYVACSLRMVQQSKCAFPPRGSMVSRVSLGEIGGRVWEIPSLDSSQGCG